MRSLIVIAVLLGSAFPASAQEAGDPTACAAIAGATERLSCYDAIFRPGGETPSGAVVIQSNQPIPARPTGRAPATMTIACTPEGPVVSFAFAGQLLSETSDDAAISFQVDQTGNAVRNLPVSADNTAVGFPAGAQSEAFLQSIEGGRRLQVRVTPIRQRSLQVVFLLSADAAAIAAVRESCL